MLLNTLKYLSLDIRALALMRICIAIVLILDLSIRISDLEAFYSNTGAVPLTLVFDHCWNDYYISLHAISGLWQVQLVLFIVAYVCAFMLLIGLRTRLFTFLSWLMLLSLHNRNELILQGGDDLLRLTLFWAMFLPWGEAYSMDQLLYRANSFQEYPPVIRNWATFAYLLQVSYVYTGSALLKGPEWNCDYTALYYVYHLDQIAYPISRYFLPHPTLMSCLTGMAYYFELLIPLLFMVPVRHGFFRIVAFVLITGFHLFNGMTIFIGLFFLIGIATITGILPSSFMDAFDYRTAKLRMFIRKRVLRLALPVCIFNGPKKQRQIPAPLTMFFVLYVLYWNLSNFSFFPFKMNDHLKFVGYTLRLDQSWGMFAPGVFKDDGWYIYEGETADGRKINLLHPRRALTYEKTDNIVSLTKNDRWRKYGEHFILADHSPIRGYLCNYFFRIWNEKHPDKRISTLRIIYMYEFTKPDYKYFPPEKEVLFECGD